MDIVQEGLDNKLACVLYQMPPSYTFSEERLINVVEQLSFDKRNVIEFRHVSWWKQEVYNLLKRYNINFCSVSYPGLPADYIITGNFLYRRMHGVPELFKSSYSDKELADLHHELPAEKNAFIYFNNTMFESGYNNAHSLQQLVETS